MRRGLKIAGGLVLAVLVLAAGFVALSLIAPKWFRPRFKTTELRAPSGSVYRIMARGPVGSLAGEKRTLGIQYLADDVSDPARLSRSADELEALLRPQLEAEGCDGLVVTAYSVVKQVGFMTVAKTVPVFFRRASSDPAAWGFFALKPQETLTAREAAVRGELYRAYAKFDRAVYEKDPRAVWDQETPDYRDTTIDGRSMDRREDMGFMQKQFAELAVVSSFTAVIEELHVQADRATATVKTSFAGGLNDESRRNGVYFDEGWSQDVWVKTPRGWRIRASVDVAAKSFFFTP